MHCSQNARPPRGRPPRTPVRYGSSVLRQCPDREDSEAPRCCLPWPRHRIALRRGSVRPAAVTAEQHPLTVPARQLRTILPRRFVPRATATTPRTSCFSGEPNESRFQDRGSRFEALPALGAEVLSVDREQLQRSFDHALHPHLQNAMRRTRPAVTRTLIRSMTWLYHSTSTAPGLNARRAVGMIRISVLRMARDHNRRAIHRGKHVRGTTVIPDEQVATF